MRTIFKAFTGLVTILLLFFVLGFCPQGMWDLSSLTRDWNRSLCTGRWSLNHWTSRAVSVELFLEISLPLFHSKGASQVAQTVKNLPAMWETRVWSLGWEEPLEKGRATHSSVLAWRMPWTEEPGGLQLLGLQSRTRWNDLHSRSAHWL